MALVKKFRENWKGISTIQDLIDYYKTPPEAA
jgi:hypothetical protein